MKKTMPRGLELALVIALVYPVDRLYAHFLFPYVAHWPFLAQPVLFLGVLLSFLVLIYVPGVKKIYERRRNA